MVKLLKKRSATALQKWIREQPCPAPFDELSPEQLIHNLAPALTLAHWLLPYREYLQHPPRYGKEQWEASPCVKIAIIGNGKQDSISSGLGYRYLPALLDIDLPFVLIMVGKESPMKGVYDYHHPRYDVKAIAFKESWARHEMRAIGNGVQAAFLFNPGFHNTRENLLSMSPLTSANDMLDEGCILPLLLQGIPVGISTQDREDGEMDNERLAGFGIQAVNPRSNPWSLDFGVVDPATLRDLPQEHLIEMLPHILHGTRLTWSKCIWDLTPVPEVVLRLHSEGVINGLGQRVAPKRQKKKKKKKGGSDRS